MLMSAAVNRYAFLCRGYRSIGGMSVRISHGNLRSGYVLDMQLVHQ